MAKKRLKKRDPLQFFAEKGDFSNKKRLKRDPTSGLGLLRDLGLPKRDQVGSSGIPNINTLIYIHIYSNYTSAEIQITEVMLHSQIRTP